jgi:ceramide glucosyltransferase
VRAAVAIQVGMRVVHDPSIVRRLWLVPLRDLVAFWVWFASFAGRQVHWRGDIFILEDGKIRPVQAAEQELVSEAEPGRDKVSVHW